MRAKTTEPVDLQVSGFTKAIQRIVRDFRDASPKSGPSEEPTIDVDISGRKGS